MITVPSGGHWHPDPQGFLDRRLRERGLTVQQFLAARPGQSWNQLVHYFDEPLAPIQLMAYVQESAAKGQWLDWYARDALARALRAYRLATMTARLPPADRRKGSCACHLR